MIELELILAIKQKFSLVGDKLESKVLGLVE